jgi:two-component system LytT family response regulator
MQYNVFIVEDEKHQQEMLLNLLSECFPNLLVIGISTSIGDAKEKLLAIKPDLVFMDVMLPPYTSFDLLHDLPNISFDIIFTTSFEEFAVKAFRLSAVDYLIKPLVRTELQNAVEKFISKRSAKAASTHIQNLLENIQTTKAENSKIALPTLTGYLFIRIRDIVRCESDNTYTTFFLLDKRKIVVSKTLKECEQMLTDYRFYRIHNSHLINMEYISEYVKGDGGYVKMSDGSQLDVSRRRKDDFMSVLKKV